MDKLSTRSKSMVLVSIVLLILSLTPQIKNFYCMEEMILT